MTNGAPMGNRSYPQSEVKCCKECKDWDRDLGYSRPFFKCSCPCHQGKLEMGERIWDEKQVSQSERCCELCKETEDTHCAYKEYGNSIAEYKICPCHHPKESPVSQSELKCEYCEKGEPHGHCTECGLLTEPIMICKCSFRHTVSQSVECKTCYGTGRYGTNGESPCPDCSQSVEGWEEELEKVDVLFSKSGAGGLHPERYNNLKDFIRKVEKEAYWAGIKVMDEEADRAISSTLSTYNKRGYCKRCNKWLQLHGEADNI